jgi:hypothetical protein
LSGASEEPERAGLTRYTKVSQTDAADSSAVAARWDATSVPAKTKQDPLKK